MTVINLSKMYREKRPFSFYNIRFRHWPDFFYASSLSVIEPYFNELNKKKFAFAKKDYLMKFLVVLNDVEVKLHDLIISESLTPGFHFKMLMTKDETKRDSAGYIRPSLDDFKKDASEFGLNNEVFVPVNEICLHYIQSHDSVVPINTYFTGNFKRKKGKKSLQERLSEYFEGLGDLAPVPVKA